MNSFEVIALASINSEEILIRRYESSHALICGVRFGKPVLSSAPADAHEGGNELLTATSHHPMRTGRLQNIVLENEDLKK